MASGTFKFISQRAKETQVLARKLARLLKKNDCLALVGNFGSGKTTFVKGLAQGLGVRRKDSVCSPSFVILKLYPARLPLYHFDLYRLDHLRDLEDIGFSEFAASGGICVIEWADNVKGLLPAGYLKIKFDMRGKNRRCLTFSATTPAGKRLLKIFKKTI